MGSAGHIHSHLIPLVYYVPGLITNITLIMCHVILGFVILGLETEVDQGDQG